MPGRKPFEYAVIRIVPRVEREEFINAGVVLFCRPLRYLNVRYELDRERLAALAPWLDAGAIQAQLDDFTLVCRGGVDAGPLGLLPQAERFRWLVAPRSTIVQPSPVHCGISSDPAAELERLLERLVRPLPLPA